MSRSMFYGERHATKELLYVVSTGLVACFTGILFLSTVAETLSLWK